MPKKKLQTVEAWGIYNKDGNFVSMIGSKEQALRYCEKGQTVHKIKIVPEPIKRKTVKKKDNRFTLLSAKLNKCDNVIEQDGYVQP